METNILMSKWSTPHSTPPFSLITTNLYAPALRLAIKEAEENIDKIASQKDSPSFSNTIAALEFSSERLETIEALLMNLNECCTDDTIQQTVLDMLPELTRFENKLWMNEKLFLRVKTIYDEQTTLNLDSEQAEVLEKYYQHFIRGGINLAPEKKERFATIVEELATLSEQFNQNVLADTNDFTLHITDPSDLSGLTNDAIATAHDEAVKRNMDGWLFTLHAPSYRPFLAFADNRTLREKMWKAYNSRGNNSNRNNNNTIIKKIVDLRLEKAHLLGYDDYASLSLSRTMAGDEITVNNFLDKLLKASLPYARKDLAEIQEFAKKQGADYELQNWDFSYWSEKLKKERYDFDSELLRPYFQLEKVREGIFSLYNKLYGITFTPNPDIQVYHEDVRVFDVTDKGRYMGSLYLDMHPRANKRSGAWMTEFRGQHNVDGNEQRPLIQVVCNFTKPTADKPSLLSFDEVETFMHEMGHAMHGMLSDVHYPSVSGTNVRHDFVEMPSQVMENWCYEPEFLNTFAEHYQTGETIPIEYIEKIRASERYLAGWLCLRQLNFGLTDMGYHTLTEPMADDVKAEDFEHAHMIELLPVVTGTCSSTSFTHIFCGGYAAGYYGYKWAEVLDADIFSKFKSDGIFNRDTAKAFRETILSRGGSIHPSILFRDFMHRDPDQDALLKRCGFVE
ncbi:MAG: M3 family metallopeptidase [Bacteroidales bacterium]|nr:M3 family metallopeptidase [Bacteroidales bacterium]